MTSQTDKKNKSLKQAKAADLILQIVNQLALEMHHGKQPKQSVNLGSMLDRDLQLEFFE